MSSGSPATHAAADHDHDHAFDGEPTDVLPADEPRTPGWLPALGIVLFVSAAVAFLATRDDGAQPAADNAAVAPPAAAPAPAQSGAADAIRRLSPDQIRALQKQIDTMRAKQPGGAAPAAQPQN
jgi:hypothetical protein